MKRFVKMMTALALFALAAQPAWADVSSQGGGYGPPNELNTAVCTTVGGAGCPSLLPAGTQVMGMKLISGSANSACALDNTAAISTASNTTVKDELYEATANETDLHLWQGPIRFNLGVTVWMVGTSTVCFVYYK